MHTGLDRRLERGIVRRRIDLAGLEHAPQHIRAAVTRPIDACDRIVERRRARQTCNQGRFRQGHCADRLVEVHAGRGADAIRTLTEKNAVQVQRQDFFLREFVLEAPCEKHFLEFAAQRALGRQHRIARELHRDRAAALAHTAGGEVAERSAHESLPVDAGMLEEPVVFGCKERVDHDLRNLVVGDRYAALLTELRDQLAVAAEHLQRQLAADLAQLGGGRDLGLQVLIRTREPEGNGQRDTEDDRDQDCEQPWQRETHAQFLGRSPCEPSGGLCIVARDTWANSPKGEDAKQPV